jgi:hypothetical protein
MELTRLVVLVTLKGFAGLILLTLVCESVCMFALVSSGAGPPPGTSDSDSKSISAAA